MASQIERNKASHEQINLDASGQLSIDGAPQNWAVDAPPLRKSRWPARLDVLQSASGLFLGLFLMAHMFFVSSILISHDAFYTIARFFEGVYFLGKPYPIMVSAVVCVITTIFILHAWLAMRKFPAGYRQYRAFVAHKNSLQHGDTALWWLQIWTGFALFFMATIHLYGMLTQPALIGPYESADRVWSGGMWPLYLMLLFAAELHASIGLYRLALQMGLVRRCFGQRQPSSPTTGPACAECLLHHARPGHPARLRRAWPRPCRKGRRTLRPRPASQRQTLTWM